MAALEQRLVERLGLQARVTPDGRGRVSVALDFADVHQLEAWVAGLRQLIPGRERLTYADDQAIAVPARRARKAAAPRRQSTTGLKAGAFPPSARRRANQQCVDRFAAG